MYIMNFHIIAVKYSSSEPKNIPNKLILQDKMNTTFSFRFFLFKNLFWINLNLPCNGILMFQTKNVGMDRKKQC